MVENRKRFDVLRPSGRQAEIPARPLKPLSSGAMNMRELVDALAGEIGDARRAGSLSPEGRGLLLAAVNRLLAGEGSADTIGRLLSMVWHQGQTEEAPSYLFLRAEEVHRLQVKQAQYWLDAAPTKLARLEAEYLVAKLRGEASRMEAVKTRLRDGRFSFADLRDYWFSRDRHRAFADELLLNKMLQVANLNHDERALDELYRLSKDNAGIREKMLAQSDPTKRLRRAKGKTSRKKKGLPKVDS